MFKLIFLLLTSLSFQVFAEKSDLSQIAYSSSWLKLLHYEKNLFGGYSSRIDGKEAFFHPKGKKDPLKELEATIKSLNENKLEVGKLKQSPWCAFVARRNFLIQTGLIKNKSLKCEAYDFWSKSLDLQAVKILFASYYTGNPASLFGHTFLKLDLKETKHDYLNYGLNFAATTGEDGSIAFALFGLTGMYEGHYSLAPYYLKLKEYSLMENRDLYEYELDLTAKEMSMMIDRIWEIESTGYFDYYFFDENCSFQILTLIESIKPELNMTKSYPDFVLPLETIKTLKKNKLIKRNSLVFQPSKVRQFYNIYSIMPDKKQTKFKQIVKSKTLPKKKLLEKDFMIKKTFEQYLSLLAAKPEKSPEEKKFFNQSLVHLSQMAKPNQESSTEEIDQDPLKGHGPHRVSVRTSIKRFNFSYDHGLHDIYDATTGYDKFSNLNYLGLDWSIQKNQAILQNFTLFEVLSLNDYVFYNKKFSFETNLNVTYLDENRYYVAPDLYGGLSHKITYSILIGFLIGPRLVNPYKSQFVFTAKIPFVIKNDWGHLFSEVYTDGEIDVGQSFILNQSTTLLLEFNNQNKNEEFFVSLRRNF